MLQNGGDAVADLAGEAIQDDVWIRLADRTKLLVIQVVSEDAVAEAEEGCGPERHMADGEAVGFAAVLSGNDEV